MIRTRIAPSPTGYFHIGTARTALFNFLYARQHKSGEFLLRIEDTDRARSKKVYEKDILAGLKWLGLTPDGKPYRQSERLKLYETYLGKLKQKKAIYEKNGATYFKVADYGTGNRISWNDLIRGEISFSLKDLKDFVIVRSDGTPLFSFTSVVDDLETKVSHVIRGEDMTSNTPLQLMIAKVLGVKAPEYGHLPLILAPDRSKLSKRHGAVAVREYERMGIVPEALVNYLALLGWNPGGNEELFTLGELVKKFKLDRVQKGGAIFDIDKLIHINRLWIKRLSDKELVRTLKPYSKLGLEPELMERVVHITRERLGRLVEFDSAASFANVVDYEPKLLVFKSSTKAQTLTGLTVTLAKLQSPKVDLKNPGSTSELLAKLVELNKLNNGDLFWPVRVALSGSETSPGPHELMWALGKDESITRIKKAIGKLE
ncbi:MAG: glutamate--tRNA ligase family protein [Patescibacteria group bacterium]